MPISARRAGQVARHLTKEFGKSAVRMIAILQKAGVGPGSLKNITKALKNGRH